jgi:hypothetical protein
MHTFDAQSKQYLNMAKSADVIYNLKEDIKIYEKTKQFSQARYLMHILTQYAAKKLDIN